MKNFNLSLGFGPASMAVVHPPRCRTIFINNQPHYLSFPWVVYIIRYFAYPRKNKFEKLYVYFSPKPVSLLTKLNYANLHNNFNNSICMGEVDIYNSMPLLEMKTKVIDAFWSSSFYGNELPLLKLESWEYLTKYRPKSILDQCKKFPKVKRLFMAM